MVSLDTNTLEKITVSQGKLRVIPKYPKEVEDTNPSVHVHFDEPQLDFSVQYSKLVHDAHLSFRVSLFWQSTRALQSEARGIIGEYRAMGMCYLIST